MMPDGINKCDKNDTSKVRDITLLIIASIALILSCLTIIGLVPVSILIVGFVLAIKTGDTNFVKMTTRSVQVIILIAAGIICANSLPHYDKYSNFYSWYNQEDFFTAIAISIIFILFTNYFWLWPITRQIAIIQKTFSNRKKKQEIVGRSNATSFSIADELMKWTKLRDDGIVSEDEFQDARRNLMSTNK
jgi:hypothetical protein